MKKKYTHATLVEYSGRRYEVDINPPLFTDTPRNKLVDEFCKKFSTDGRIIVNVHFKCETIWK